MRQLLTFIRAAWTATVAAIRVAFNEPGRDLRVAYCRLLHNAALGLVGGAVALYFHQTLTADRAVAAVAGALVLFFTGAALLSGEQQ